MRKVSSIFEKLKSDLENGLLGASGDRFLTGHEIAKSYGVSYVTATNFIKKLDEEGLLASVNGRNYICLGTYKRHSDLHKRTLSARIKCVGLHVREIDNPFFSKFAHMLSLQLGKMGYRCIIMESVNDFKREKEILGAFIHWKCGGVFSFSGLKGEADIGFLRNYPLPFVMLGMAPEGMSAVAADNYRSGRQAAQYLLSCGYGKFAYAGIKGFDPLTDMRFKGYRDYLREQNIEIDGDLIFPVDHASDSQDHFIGGILRKKAERDCVGIFCHHDLIAAKLFSICAKSGVNCPDEVGIIGFDDLPGSDTAQLKLTTFGYNYAQMVNIAIEKLLNNIENLKNDGSCSMVDTILYARGTTKPLRKS